MEQKTALVSILGRPNAGKSTLLNKILEQKISIVTPKVQTTRSIITGIYTKENIQLIFLDTPGIFSPNKRLEKAMVRSAWSSIAGANVICLLIDLHRTRDLDSEFTKILKHLGNLSTPKIILFNKSDLFEQPYPKEFDRICCCSNILQSLKTLPSLEKSAPFIQYLEDNFGNEKTLLISAKSGKNIGVLLEYLKSHAPHSPFLYSEDEVTTAPMRFLSSEITREQLFLQLSEELPYNLTVETDQWVQVSENEVKIYQSIIVNRAAHKKIILGSNGNKIKNISTKARIEISKAFDLKVHLFLFVKVREDWDNKSIYYNNMGLNFVKE